MCMPTIKIKAHANCTAIGMRYEPVSYRPAVALLMMFANKIPMVMASW